MLRLIQNDPYEPHDLKLLIKLGYHEIVDKWLAHGLVNQEDVWVASALAQVSSPTWKPQIIHSESEGVRTLRRNMKRWDKRQKFLRNNRKRK